MGFAHANPSVARYQGNRFDRLLMRFGQLGLASVANRLRRRLSWFTRGLTARKFANIISAGCATLMKREAIPSWPVILRIDISPVCNLHCTVCVHAEPNGHPPLESQEFHTQQRMSLEQFRGIVEEVKAYTCGVSLYYLGDPLVHPDLDEMCRIAGNAGLNVHYSTNMSFALSDARIQRLVTSGVTHLTVCVDGLSQETYERTRVGGRIDLVLANLERICEYRRATKSRVPDIEVQYIKYQHNLAELEEARRRFLALGVDQVYELWGGLHNYTDRDPGGYNVIGPKQNRMLAQCHWPYFFTQIKYNGDVLPCCCHRLGQQYARDGDPRCVGNVFATSVREVWDSREYRLARRLAARPQSIETDPSLSNHFCAACPRLFDTDFDSVCHWGQDCAFEDMYTIGENGRPVRRRETPSAIPSAGSPRDCAETASSGGGETASQPAALRMLASIAVIRARRPMRRAGTSR